MKKLISCALIFVLVLSMLPVTALADEPVTIADVTFSDFIRDESYSDELQASNLGMFGDSNGFYSPYVGLRLPQNATITVTVGGDRNHIEFAGYRLTTAPENADPDLYMPDIVFTKEAEVTEPGTYKFTKADIEALVGDFDLFALCVKREKVNEDLRDWYMGYEGEELAIYAMFSGDGAGTEVTGPAFADVKESDYFAPAVAWAVEKSITSGTSSTTFSPNDTCTTAQVLTFLWRSQGSPEPSGGNTFSDLSASDYYYKAVLWASEKGLISGTSLNGGAPCTRSMTVTYLWKLAGSPATAAAPFTDVAAGSDYAQAVAWAVEKSITSGTSNTTFSPNDTCTRGQIVTFLFRAFA